ncbi:hypothetical protein K435DRAFT_970264 [Dendrothele bispora CBS 962.96]|uniref:Uncharacterized protein n=1 Tax=Dendrothele bispora (strain CBS 962.96) TaxID=1314807 RepID=A0A4S8LC81_DENBC|nr:hypothetical protein K435DRAFT_970264 [Dendrothele bispora CBS 962.96]
MRDSMLVNSTWMSLYMRASCTDVHIPNSRYAFKLISIFQGGSTIYNRLAPDLYDTLCRSITFRGDFKSGPIEISMYTITRFLSKTPQGINRLPYLRRFSFELVDQTLNAVFPISNIFPIHFPSNVTTLEVLFYYLPSTLSCHQSMKEALLNVMPSRLTGGSLPCIHTLRVYGAGAGAMRDLVRACTHLRVYDSDVSILELPKRFQLGMQRNSFWGTSEEALEDLRTYQARIAAHAALDDIINMKIKMLRRFSIYMDEEVLEAAGVYQADGVSGVLIDLHSELADLLKKEQRDRIDVLAMMFMRKAIKVSEKVIWTFSEFEKTGLVGLYAYSKIDEELQPRLVTYDIEISPRKPSTSHVNKNNDSRARVQSSQVNISVDDGEEGYTTAEEGHSYSEHDDHNDHNDNGVNVAKKRVGVDGSASAYNNGHGSLVELDTASATPRKSWIRKTASRVMCKVGEIRSDTKSKSLFKGGGSRGRSC